MYGLLIIDKDFEPSFQVVPGLDMCERGRAVVLEHFVEVQEHMVDKPVLALEVIIELALSGSRLLQDFVNAGSRNSFSMKEIQRGFDHLLPGAHVLNRTEKR